MLTKFNNLFNKIIFENIQEEQQCNKYIQDINTCDAFFHSYIEPLAEKTKVSAFKARFNVFRLYGPAKNIINFFKNFKVNKDFMQDASKFQIFTPMISFCQNEHKYNKIDNHLNGIGTEGETLNTYLDATTETFNNQKEINKNIFGRWYDLVTYNEIQTDQTLNEIQKALTPRQTANKITEYCNNNQDCFIYIEFTVNTNKLPNNSFEELAKAVPITNGNVTLSDVINTRPDVLDPKPNHTVLTTKTDLSKVQPITKESNKAVKKTVKSKTSNFDQKNKIKTKLKTI